MGSVGYNVDMGQVRLTGRRAKFIELYFGKHLFNATAAAAEAGFKHPSVAGYQLTKKLAPLLAAKRVEHDNKMEMQGKEIREKLTSIARTDNHKDQVRALELLAKITGQLSDNIKISQDRSAMEADLVAALEALRTQGTSSH